MSEQRRLAAILVADVVGYSRLVGADESGTLARLAALRREIVDPNVARHAGRLFKQTGDGFLVEFASAVEAVTCAIEIQKAAGPDSLPLRIGIHVGDVVVEGEDLMGDGVNIAARIEGIAEPGGIAVSRAVHEQVRDRLAITFDDRGEIELKNIGRPVHIFAVGGNATPTPPALKLPDKPSIAVLPFINMSGDPEQEYFTDGLTEDIITELSRFHELFVIARNSTFSYKGQSPDVRRVGQELGVRYVLEGSIRRADSRIRVTGQLVDTLNGAHIWADRYDRVLEDVFAVQEELTQSIVRTIAPFISEAEVTKARRRPGNLGAYEIAVRAYAKAWEALVKSDRFLCDEAIGEARAALAIDPDSTLALNAFGVAQSQHLLRGTAVDRETAWREAVEAVTRSIELDRSNGSSHALKGSLLIMKPGGMRQREALESARRGHDLNPHDMRALIGVAHVENMAGSPEKAIEHLHQALRISPRDRMRPSLHQQLAMASFSTRQYANGVAYALLGIDEAPRLPPLHVFLATNYVGLGEIEKAKAAMAEALRLAPEFAQRHLTGDINGQSPHRERQVMFARIAAGLEDPEAAEALR